MARCYNPHVLNKMRNIFVPAFWRSFAALVCVLLTTSFMNTTVFPLFDTIWAGAREFTIIMGFLAYLLYGLASFFKPQMLASKANGAIAFGALMLAAMILPFAFALGNLPLLLFAVCCSALGRSWGTLLTGMGMARLTQAQAGICVTLALMVDDLVSIAAWYVPAAVSLVLFIALPAASVLLSAGPARPFLTAAAKAEPPLDLAVTQPNTFLPLDSAVFVCLFLFRAVFGFTLRFGEVSGTPLMDSWAVVAMGVFALYMLISRKSLPADTLICWSTLLVIAGFYIVAAGWGSTAVVGVTMLSAGSELTNLVAWLVLVSIARRNLYGAVAAFSWGHCVMSLGSITGAQLALFSNSSVLAGDAGFTLLSGAIIIGFAAYALFVLRKVSFNKIIESVAEAVVVDAEGGADAAANGGGQEPLSLEQRCAIIAQERSLTKREHEVLSMLARGRNRAYIEENLVISRNTVNAHVKHIYGKLGIHSHQDLLDLVEAVQAPAQG